MLNNYRIAFCILFLLKICRAQEEDGFDEEAIESESNYSPRILPRDPRFFTIFPTHIHKTGNPSNTKCRDSMGEWGRCLSRKQCLSVDGGNPTDTKCTGNQGICCLIKLSWDQSEMAGIITIKNNLSHIVTSKIVPSQALFVIPRQKDICQLRLDFKAFHLSPANETGFCGLDTMTISGAENLTPSLQLCGIIDSTEHIYLHYGSSDTISINMDIRNEMSIHDILVTFIKCDSTVKAPDGCTQYYREQNANVKSFNYGHQQLNNQHYAVCIQASRGSQSITWSTCGDPVTDFFISGNAPGNVDAICSGDRVTIPGTVNGTFCGGIFREVQTSLAKPFALYVDFDKLEMTPPGPLSSNGCPFPFQCTMQVNGEYVPRNVTDGTCPRPYECTVLVGHGSGVVHDVQNTGFCLRFMKA